MYDRKFADQQGNELYFQSQDNQVAWNTSDGRSGTGIADGSAILPGEPEQQTRTLKGTSPDNVNFEVTVNGDLGGSGSCRLQYPDKTYTFTGAIEEFTPGG